MKLQSTLAVILTTILALGGLCLQNVNAQTIGSSELETVREAYKRDNPQTKALQNSISNENNLSKLALNREFQGEIDHYFKYKVDVKGVTDQKKSGRCWMFTSMNVLRPSIMEKYDIAEFDFSHNYLYFWDILEKSNLFLENVIATKDFPMDDREVSTFFSSPVNDGGVWNLYYNIAKKYGVVPKSIMPETAHSNGTARMASIINERLRKGGMELRDMDDNEKQLREAKLDILQDIYKVLAMCLGEPPTEFTWRYKDSKGEIKALENYTPLQFYKEITPADYSPENYIMIMNDPIREYYQVYEIKNYRNAHEGINWTYLNLPFEDIEKAALASIKGNEAMYVSCDVAKYYNSTTGISDKNMYNYDMLFDIDLDMNKKDRILSRQSGSSHAMALIACDVDANDNPIKWEFENSWGATAGNKGYITFTNDWFREYLFRIVIHTEYLDEKALEAAKSEPILLPVWDYMF